MEVGRAAVGRADTGVIRILATAAAIAQHDPNILYRYTPDLGDLVLRFIRLARAVKEPIVTTNDGYIVTILRRITNARWAKYTRNDIP